MHIKKNRRQCLSNTQIQLEKTHITDKVSDRMIDKFVNAYQGLSQGLRRNKDVSFISTNTLNV
jgi:hypothetical protein